MDWQFSLAGLLIGLLVGMTGMGGGSLMTPLLVLVFGFKPTLAIGTDILHGAIFKSFGAAQHRRLGNVNLRLAAWMLAGSAPTSLLGVAVASWLERRYGDGFQDAAKQMLGAALVLCGVGFLVKAFLRPHDGAGWRLAGRDRWIALATGVAGGFVVGLTSVGSGTFFGLVLLLAFPLSAATLVGTDIFHAAALLWVAGAGHLVAGNVDLHATAWLLVGSIPGVLAGGHFTVRVPDRLLRAALATVLFLSGVKLVDSPGANAIVVAVVAVAVAAGTALAIRRLVAGRPAPAGERSR
ncbi:MAG TPA: sulfite exporter TauE/SafE family protein [Gaiellaceae bacterium]|nr:sulfite exporter TauE/SafE family protein [Gaiellaceae bacterium]